MSRKAVKLSHFSQTNSAFYLYYDRTLLLFSRPMRDKDTSALREMFIGAESDHWLCLSKQSTPGSVVPMAMFSTLHTAHIYPQNFKISDAAVEERRNVEGDTHDGISGCFIVKFRSPSKLGTVSMCPSN